MRAILTSLAFLALSASGLVAPTYQPVQIILPPHEPTEQEIKDYIVKAAERVGVDAKLALHIAWMESRFKPDLPHIEHNGTTSWGVFQLNDVLLTTTDEIDPLDYRQNIDVGISLLADYSARYDGDAGRIQCAWTHGPYGSCE
jgi:soluble lytic murein transglycosylase-like protein